MPKRDNNPFIFRQVVSSNTLFHFVRADKDAEYKVIITGKEVNLSNGEGMQVPCLLPISGTKNMLQLLCKNIHNQ